jgi:predicted S18 family serine protease
MDKGVKSGIIILLAAIIALSTAMPALAITKTGHIKLLAVYQEGETFKGSPADVQLEIKKGTGRVFLETIPLSKVDTQLSTRFAKEMACKFTEEDCKSYDFFYTIKSPAGIVGGPSAGGAIAALTAAMLLDHPVDQHTAMTGTINSGELIGPIGSLKEKISAAKENGIKKVIIPSVQVSNTGDNQTAAEYSAKLGIEIVGVATLREAVQEITGKTIEEDAKEVTVPEEYIAVMRNVSLELCNRSDSLLAEIDATDLAESKYIVFDRVNLLRESKNLTDKGSRAFKEGNYYSAASYCFGASIKANTLLYGMRNLSPDDTAISIYGLQKKINAFDRQTESRKKETITDLQTYMIVKERILEASQQLEAGRNDSGSLAYTEERLNSAIEWSQFFGKEGAKYNLDAASLQNSCQEILAEVDERFQYLNLFFPGLLDDMNKNLITANKYHQRGDYALCVYLASKTKAEANIMVTLLGVKEDVLDEVLNQKLAAAEKEVAQQIDNGIFPIIAYSYYEYATSLKEENKYAAMLYAEYALELSDIDIYFEKTGGVASLAGFGDVKTGLARYLPTVIFIWGVIVGFLLGWVVVRERTGKKKTEPAKKISLASRRREKTRTKLRLK